MRLLFLDIDGVLNSSTRAKEAAATGKNGLMGIDPLPVEHLNAITDGLDVSIVVSSTWRIGKSVEDLQNILQDAGVLARVIGKTPSNVKGTGFGSDALVFLPRSAEIAEFLRTFEHRDHVESFVILDDDRDANFDKRLVLTTWQYGLEKPHVQRARQILGVPIDLNQLFR